PVLPIQGGTQGPGGDVVRCSGVLQIHAPARRGSIDGLCCGGNTDQEREHGQKCRCRPLGSCGAWHGETSVSETTFALRCESEWAIPESIPWDGPETIAASRRSL